MHRRWIVVLSLTAFIALGFQALAQGQIENYEPVTTEMLLDPPDGEWLMYRRTYDAWGYSPLDQINRENVADLQLVWSRVMEPGNNETTPLVHDGVMFLGTSGGVTQAVDAATGDLIWEYRRELPPAEELEVHSRYMRSLALHENMVYQISADNFLVALDATNGQLVWETDRGEASKVSGPTGPLIVGDVIVAGSSCSTSDIRCYITGHDLQSGEELWRFYPVPAVGEPGDETWAGMPFESRWKAGVWHMVMYDPELDLIYFGSNSVGPSSPTARGTGDAALFGTNTRYAARPETGEIVWSKQMHPMSSWDQECTLEMPLIDTEVNPNPDASGMMAINPNVEAGSSRKLIYGVPCKLGTVWAFDRETGDFVYAKSALEYQNMYESIDDQGNVQVNEDVVLNEIGKTYFVCPTFSGGRNWAPTAYSPLTGALYMPSNNACADMTPFTAELSAANGYAVQNVMKEVPGLEGKVGRIDAINVSTGETMWTYERPAPRYSPVMTTGGYLLFSGNIDRVFEAIDQETGEVLWDTRLPGQVSGHAMSYEVDGKQYVAVTIGGSLSGNSWARFIPGVDGPDGGSAVYVFALPDAQ